MPNRFFLLIAVALTASCGVRKPTDDGRTTPSEGEGVVRLALAGEPPLDAAVVRFTVKSSADGASRVREVPLENHPLPASADAGADAGRSFADALFVLAQGRYQVSAALLDVARKPLANCTGTGSVEAVVRPGVTVEIGLRLSCGQPMGTLDVVVAINHLPFLEALQVEGGKFLCVGEAAVMTAHAKDPDADPVTLDWTVAASGGAAETGCLAHRGPGAVFTASEPGNHEVTITVSDGRGPPQKVAFPLYVSACPNSPAPLCARTVFDARFQGPATLAGVCPCAPVARMRLPRAGESGLDVMPPYLYNPTRVLLVTTEPPSAAAGGCKSAGPGWVAEPADPAGAGTPATTKPIWSGCANPKETTCTSVTTECVYRWNQAGPPDYTNIEALLASGPSKLACDQPMLAAHQLADSLPGTLWQEMRRANRTGMGYVDVGTLRADPPPVRVAVIDSAIHPYAKLDGRDTYGHGRAVGRIIGDLMCADPKGEGCGGQISNYLALDRRTLETPPDLVNGGIYGDLSTLAAKIHQALDDWAAKGSAEPQVINLSLGFDDRHLAQLPKFRAERVAVHGPGDCPLDQPDLLWQSVERALSRASCMGALVIAAAGNADVVTVDEQPVLPAGWERRPAPGPEDCRAFGIPAGWGRGPTSSNWVRRPFNPLVFAAAGKASDLTLSNSRRFGLARFFAEAAGLVTEEPRPGTGGHTQVLSGTSAAAAVTSGVAAAAWSFRPGADAYEVMSWLHDSNPRVNLTMHAPSTGAATGEFGAPVLPTFFPADCPAAACTSPTGGESCPRLCQLITVSHCGAIAVARGQPPASCPEPGFGGPPAFARTTPVGSPLVEVASDDIFAEVDQPLWGGRYAAWVAPEPEPFGCRPPGCDITNDVVERQFAGAFVTPPGGQTIQSTYVALWTPFASSPQTLNVPVPNPIETPFRHPLRPVGGVRADTFAATLINFIQTGAGLSVYTEPVVVR